MTGADLKSIRKALSLSTTARASLLEIASAKQVYGVAPNPPRRPGRSYHCDCRLPVAYDSWCCAPDPHCGRTMLIVFYLIGATLREILGR
jgi:hypothetical protein